MVTVSLVCWATSREEDVEEDEDDDDEDEDDVDDVEEVVGDEEPVEEAGGEPVWYLPFVVVVVVVVVEGVVSPLFNTLLLAPVVVGPFSY